MESTASADREESSGERKSKRRKLSSGSPLFPPPPAPSRWTTEPEQRAYSTKLLEALRRVRGRAAAVAAASSSPPAPRSRAVREAADRVLAFAARGRTRWSRAILVSSRVRIRAARLRPRKPAPPEISPALKAAAAAAAARGNRHHRDRSNNNNSGSSSSNSNNNKEGESPVLQRKAKVLGSLVPGCRKLPLSMLLDETSDYIAALQMQVRAMTALAEVLSSSTPSSSAAAAAASSSSPSSSHTTFAAAPDRPGYPPPAPGR